MLCSMPATPPWLANLGPRLAIRGGRQRCAVSRAVESSVLSPAPRSILAVLVDSASASRKDHPGWVETLDMFFVPINENVTASCSRPNVARDAGQSTLSINAATSQRGFMDKESPFRPVDPTVKPYLEFAEPFK